MLHVTISQSIIKNKDIVNNIDWCLNKLNFKLNTYFSDKGKMKNWKFTKAYRLPLLYGGSKKEEFLNKFLNTYKVATMEIEGIEKFNKNKSLTLLPSYKLYIKGDSLIANNYLIVTN